MRRIDASRVVTALALVGAAAVSGCGSQAEIVGQNFEAETLDAYLTAIPSESRLEASVPVQALPEDGEVRETLQATSLGESELAKVAVEAASQINAPVREITGVLHEIVELPPTHFDVEEHRFVWGPWPHQDGFGDMLLFVQENDPGDDFEYSYALGRILGTDFDTFEAVIWGAATPDPEVEDRGVGVTLWDLEANRRFDETHDPEFESADSSAQGRFVMLYGHGVSNTEPETDVFYNHAVFRSFLGEDAEPGSAPFDVDYLYGRVAGDPNQLDFMDFSVVSDVCDTSSDACFENDTVDDADENFDFRAAFINEGVGRAEVGIEGGDLPSAVEVAECWNDELDRVFVEVSSGAEEVALAGECPAVWSQPLSDMGLPGLGDIDPELSERLDCVASNGLEGCE